MSAVYALTIFHTAISLVAIVAGFPVVRGFLNNTFSPGWTKTYLAATGLTLITSFLFPYNGFTPAIGVGILCILIFVPVLYAWRVGQAGFWRPVYVVGSIALLYFNCFVLVVQSFLKIPALHALAPAGNEPPFAIVQGIVLVAAIAVAVLGVRRSRMRSA